MAGQDPEYVHYVVTSGGKMAYYFRRRNSPNKSANRSGMYLA